MPPTITATCPVCGHAGPVVDHGPYDYEPAVDDLLVLEGNVDILNDREVVRYVECTVCHKGFDIALPAN